MKFNENCLFSCLFFKEITLTEGSKVFDSWKKPPPPVFMEFYFFNVTNPDEFLAGDAKPRVVEVGPYTYRYAQIHNSPSAYLYLH